MDEEKIGNDEYKKLYKKNNRNRKIVMWTLAVVMIYTFFFTSKITISPDISEETSNIGQEYEYGIQRSYTLIDAVYSKEAKTMEVVLELKNSAHDNINDYYYVAEVLNGNSGKLEIEEIYNEELFTVVRIYNVPKRYKELTLYFAPKLVEMKDVTDEMTGICTLNKKNVVTGNLTLNRGKTSYLKERFDVVINERKKDLKKLQKECEKLKNELNAIENDKRNFEKNKAYMTEDEIKKWEDNVVFNTEEMNRIESELEQKNEEIKVLKKEIEESEEKKERL